MDEGLQPELIKNHSVMRWIIMCGAMLLIAFLFGFVPVLISYRKIMSASRRVCFSRLCPASQLSHQALGVSLHPPAGARDLCIILAWTRMPITTKTTNSNGSA